MILYTLTWLPFGISPPYAEQPKTRSDFLMWYTF